MKIVWLFPPARKGEFQNISQYRFTKRMKPNPFTRKSPSIIYPYLAAMGVTQLSQEGHDVRFLDCPTMGYNWGKVHCEMLDVDLIVLEARTPQMPMIWQVCKDLRAFDPSIKIALYGDHVTWNPAESLPYADYIVKGGNYDVGILNLVEALNGGLMGSNNVLEAPAMPILDKLPFCDRELVSWKKYYESWRNRDKFFWIMSMRGCLYRCIF